METGEVQMPCAKCGQPAGTRSPTALISAGSAGVTGGHGTGPLCGECNDEVQHLYALFSGSNGLGFCGCGCPEEAYALVRDVLSLAPFHQNWQAVRDFIGERAYYFVLYAIDRAELLEHGGSIGGSWLSQKGAWCLPLLRKWEWDDIAQAGFPHYGEDGNDDGGCGPGCPHWEASTEDYRKGAIRRESAAAAKATAGDWQAIPPNVWTKLAGADASVVVKAKTLVRSRPGVLSDGKL